MKTGVDGRFAQLARRVLRAAGLRPTAPDYLGRQVAMSWEKERRNLEWFGLRDGMDVLDLGCGGGHFTERLLEAWPGLRVTALDRDPAMIVQARQRLGRRAVLVEGAAEDTGLAAASFDFAHARAVFQHLRDPLLVAREAWRVLRPGGLLVVTDGDDGLFGVTDPPVEGLGRLLQRFGAAQAANGGDRQVGRRLTRILGEAGFVEVALECVAVHSDEAGLDVCFPQLDAAPLEWLQKAGHLGAGERQELRAQGEAFHGAPAPYAIVLLFTACGIKPC